MKFSFSGLDPNFLSEMSAFFYRGGKGRENGEQKSGYCPAAIRELERQCGAQDFKLKQWEGLVNW